MASLSSCQGCSFPAEALHTSQGELSFRAHRAGSNQENSAWYMGTWNVRMLLDVDGSIETAKRSGDVSVTNERKIDQVVSELDRYDIVVGALQETKWFGTEVYRVGGSVVLTAGRDVPGGNEVRQRGEGVAIVLSGDAVRAWNSFFDTLQDALLLIPSDECFVMLGDFNALVGSRGADDECWYERGPHGYGEPNEAGKELLSFLSTNEATVCNSWFQKSVTYRSRPGSTLSLGSGIASTM